MYLPHLKRNLPRSELISTRHTLNLDKKFPSSFQNSTSYKKYRERITARDRIITLVNKSKVSDFNVEADLIDAKNIYDEFQRRINPTRYYIDSLSPEKKHNTLIACRSKFELMPQEEYRSYKIDTMPQFRSTCFRIKKARENIRIAKQLSFKYAG